MKDAIGRATGRVRDALKKQYEKLKARYQKWKDKRKAGEPARQQKRLEAAKKALVSLLRRGIKGTLLKAALLGLKLRYRLTSAKVVSENDDEAKIELRINPTAWEIAKKTAKEILTGIANVSVTSWHTDKIDATNLMVIQAASHYFKLAVAQISAANPGISRTELGRRPARPQR